MKQPICKPGQVFKDTFRVENRLSGSKHAYKLTHLGLGTNAVLELVADARGVEELDYKERQSVKKTIAQKRQRIELLAAQPLPHLARILDFFENEECLFLVREWLPGMSLRELVANSLRPLPQETALNIGHQVLELVDHLSKKELVLGTLCPDYLVVGEDSRVTVTDFGVAAHREGKTDFEAFGCPELLGEVELDTRADLYSVGALLYFAVTQKELPPIWERITHKDSLPSPLELSLKVDGRFWSTLESLLSLNLVSRPQSVAETLALFENADFEDSPESSPNTWYPEKSGLMLADSYPFAPFSAPDWILKIVQALVGRARQLDIVQTRSLCTLELRMAAPDIPTPSDILKGLTTDEPIECPTVAELARGLRIVGEFRNFKLSLDDWKQSWTLECRGGKIRTHPHETSGLSGLRLEVAYQGHSTEMARQRADEYNRLVRRTRLCPIPITVGKRHLSHGRGRNVSEHSADITELYLASASFPETGKPIITSVDESEAMTQFSPPDGGNLASHIDVRCLVSPSENRVAQRLKTGYGFLRKPSGLLWYRHGVLCGRQILEKQFPLQLDIHLKGDHLEAANSGLSVSPPDWLKAEQLRPLLELKEILPVTKLKLEELWAANPPETYPIPRALFGMAATPLLVLFAGKTLGTGLLLKKAALGGALKTSAASGASVGAASARSTEAAVRSACLKAIEAFLQEEL